MRRTARDRTKDQPKPVERIELSEGHPRRKLILVCVLVLIAAAAFAYGVHQLLTVDSGWQTVQVTKSDAPDCSGDFVFQYDLSGSATPTADFKAVTLIYAELTKDGYALFHPTQEQAGIVNVAYLNAHPNEEVTVEPLLYESFRAMAGTRYLYLGPVYAMHQALCFSADDEEAAQYDPDRNPEIAAFYRDVAAYAADPAAIELELLGENRVRLNVSEEYLRYGEENGVEAYIDFGWLTNAFLIDAFAERLTAEGYTAGCISSYDGFIRCLDRRQTVYSLNLFVRQGNTVSKPGRMDYTGPRSLVVLRDYPMNSQDTGRYYEASDGRLLTCYIDPADGQSKSALHELYAYAETASCAQLALAMAPAYLADRFDAAALEAITEAGGDYLYYADGGFRHSEASLTLQDPE